MIPIPKYRVELVRDRDIHYEPSRNLLKDAAAILHQLLDRSPVEQFACIYVNFDNKIEGAEIVAVGSIDHVEVSMRDLFRGAILASVPTVILGHNHPSGPTLPSPQDMNLTFTAMNAGMTLGIQVWDHVIVSPDGSHTSIHDHSEKEALDRIMSMSPADQQAVFEGLLGHLLPPPSAHPQFKVLKGRGDNTKIGTNLGDLLSPLLNKKV